MVTRIRSGALDGLDGYGVTVEVDAGRGLPVFQIVGLPNAAVRESRERVLAALRNSGLRFPAGRVTVNLAPADVRKEGASFDVAIALGVAAAQTGARPDGAARRDTIVLGELSLCGALRPVRGLLAIVLAAVSRGERRFLVPAAQAPEARLVGSAEVIGVATLAEAFAWWRNGIARRETIGAEPPGHPAPWKEGGESGASAFLGLVGQPMARRAALIAAAGRHNLLLVGPPGTGKTRLARAVRALLPDLAPAAALEATRIHSAANALRAARLMRHPPLRTPHHTVTRAGLIGGGVPLRPGEATLAHLGVLFLDELSEFSPAALDALREPLEEGRIVLARGGDLRTLPAGFQLVAAMNPCRCGHLGSARRACSCSPALVARHRGRLSGPLLDRIDLFVEMGDPPPGLLAEGLSGAGSGTPPPDGAAASTHWADLRAAVTRVGTRLAREPLPTADNCPDPRAFVIAAGLDGEARDYLEAARQRLALSVRGVLRCARVARTVSLLAAAPTTRREHVAEALRFRQEALPGWGGAEAEPLRRLDARTPP